MGDASEGGLDKISWTIQDISTTEDFSTLGEEGRDQVVVYRVGRERRREEEELASEWGEKGRRRSAPHEGEKERHHNHTHLILDLLNALLVLLHGLFTV